MGNEVAFARGIAKLNGDELKILLSLAEIMSLGQTRRSMKVMEEYVGRKAGVKKVRTKSAFIGLINKGFLRQSRYGYGYYLSAPYDAPSEG